MVCYNLSCCYNLSVGATFIKPWKSTRKGTILANQTLITHEEFINLVQNATKAPSGHNTQPWQFHLDGNTIEIHPDFSKELPVVDPNHRELFISLGCAAENLIIAASTLGYRSTAQITDDGNIKVQLLKSEVEADPLAAQIPLRQSNRSAGNGEIIPADQIEQLKNIKLYPGANIHLYQNGSQEAQLIADFVRRGNDQQMSNPAFKNELFDWMRLNKKQQDATNDGVSYAVFGAPNLPIWMVKPIMKNAINAAPQNKKDAHAIEMSSHLVLFTTDSNTLTDWVNLGRTLERFLLTTTELGIANAHLNQPNEIQELSIEMAGKLGLKNEYTTVILRLGYANPMPFSKRHDANEVII